MIRQAINAATQPMFFIKRGVARSRLRDRTKIPMSLTFRFEDGRVTTTYEHDRSYTSPLDGSPVAVKLPQGENATLTQTYENGELAVVFTTDEGVRRDTFRLSPDGSGLTMEVSITSSQLPQPVGYGLVYERSAQAR